MGHDHTVVWCSVHTKHARPSLGILTVCMLRLTAPSEHHDHLISRATVTAIIKSVRPAARFFCEKVNYETLT